ncbi:uncharacterized protein LOC143177335 [Calliopsis andreniformis]|uniref:uncharacterized protein LOC143177335 n=1 Tax=Calliopsis andreniformis TaxID=337506 RepID=UPI003FCE2420
MILLFYLTEERVKLNWKNGAVIEDGTLRDLDANAPSVAAAPSCQIAFLADDYTENDAASKIRRESLRGDEDVLNVPVYASAQRDILICSLPVGCPREERGNWLRRGVAFHLKLT